MWYEAKVVHGKYAGISYFWQKDSRETRWEPPSEGFVSIEQQQTGNLYLDEEASNHSNHGQRIQQHQGDEEANMHNGLSQVNDEVWMRRQYGDQVHHQGEDQALPGVIYHHGREEDDWRETPLYSFSAEPNYGVLTGIKPRFIKDPFPDHLLRVMPEYEATILRNTFDGLFEAHRSTTKIFHTMCWIWLGLIIVSSLLFVWGPKPENGLVHMTLYFVVMFGSMPCLIIIGCCYDCVCGKSGQTKERFISFVKHWNDTNAHRGLALSFSEGFWDSVYPKRVVSRYTLASDIKFYQNLPNIYIHLYQITY